MSAFSRLFLQHVPKASRVGVALGGGAALIYSSNGKQEERKIAYCESPRYNLNKASLEPLTRIVWPNSNDQEWTTRIGDAEIDLTTASKETIGHIMLEYEIQKLVKQRYLLAKVMKKWNDPSYGEWMEDNDVAVDKVVTELGELWNDFNVISDCRASNAIMTRDLTNTESDDLSNKDAQTLAQLVGLAYRYKVGAINKVATKLRERWNDFNAVSDDRATKTTTQDLTHIEGDLSNKDARMVAQLVGLTYQCKGAICRIGELVAKEELDDKEMLQIQSDLHFLRTATQAVVPWLQSYDEMVQEDLDWMYRECVKLEDVQQEKTSKLAKEREEQDKIEWTKGTHRLKKNTELINDENRLKKKPLQQQGRLPDEQSSSISARRSQ